MKKVILSAAVGIALLGVGAGATYYYDLRQVPAPIRSACHAFESAYNDAEARAKQYNDEHLQSEMAHPARASDDWRAAEEAKLEEGALILQRQEKELPDTWAGFPWMFQDTVQKMSGMQTVTADDGSVSTGPYSSVDQSNALSNLHAVCVGR
jgi:hypothetical protein